jgi:hypothetical protein
MSQAIVVILCLDPLILLKPVDESMRLFFLFIHKLSHSSLVQQKSIIAVLFLHSGKFVVCSSRTHAHPLRKGRPIVPYQWGYIPQWF